MWLDKSVIGNFYYLFPHLFSFIFSRPNTILVRGASISTLYPRSQGKEAKALSVLAEQDLILETPGSNTVALATSSSNLAYTLVTQREPEHQVHFHLQKNATKIGGHYFALALKQLISDFSDIECLEYA